jgi:hypothetical protein
MRLERTPDKREVGSSTLPRPTSRISEFEFRISDLRVESRYKPEIRNPKSEIGLGGVAQLGERLPCTQEVIGSIPFTSTSKDLGVKF